MDIDDYKLEEHNKGIKIANDFANALNSMTFDKEVIEGFITGITTQHRTIQQSSMRAIYSLLMKWAEMGEQGIFDSRNESTVKFCQDVKEMAEKSGGINYFPFI